MLVPFENMLFTITIKPDLMVHAHLKNIGGVYGYACALSTLTSTLTHRLLPVLKQHLNMARVYIKQLKASILCFTQK